jgi:signal transduction histidine kinase
VNAVHESCKVALDTLNDLLIFDKIDEGKLVIEIEDINPWTLLIDTSKPFEINAKQDHVAFTISCIDPEITQWSLSSFIHADKFKLSQVIRNLISNALKFTNHKGDGYVKVKLEKILKRDSTLMNSPTLLGLFFVLC